MLSLCANYGPNASVVDVLIVVNDYHEARRSSFQRWSLVVLPIPISIVLAFVLVSLASIPEGTAAEVLVGGVGLLGAGGSVFGIRAAVMSGYSYLPDLKLFTGATLFDIILLEAAVVFLLFCVFFLRRVRTHLSPASR